MNRSAAQFPYPWQRCKIVHLVRHGQAMHNVDGNKNREALLSLIYLKPSFPHWDCSRTMQTAFGVFGNPERDDYAGGNGKFSAISADDCPQIMAVELCRDRLGVRPCDMRRRMDGEDDSMWNPDVREPEEEIAARMVLFMKWLWTRPEQEIVIVSHGIILQHILYILGNDCHQTVRTALCKRFDNCELRSVLIVNKRFTGLLTYSKRCCEREGVKGASFQLIALINSL
ncbi:Phosphoglycerate mutase family protein, putative isoform 1 [Hibiscus syriacus]|uniref:Phosphoglycerate mutase family protein, putative isoform 1 n=1 Tax=Hibiscus syriacus TaxID=106335 RepID=A0A6A2Z518_HIBSY|nr:Phosphoglycerate mutase family protein, putative isoform 1 [Hibiscus syriacus]